MFFFALLFFTKRYTTRTCRLGLFSICKREAKNAGGCGGFFGWKSGWKGHMDGRGGLFARLNETRWRGVVGGLFFACKTDGKVWTRGRGRFFGFPFST